MTIHGRPLQAALIALALAVPAAAQDTGTGQTVPDETAPVQTAPSAPQAAETTPLPVPVPVRPEGEPAPEGPEFVTETFDDWDRRCTVDKTNCFMYQLARDEAGNPVAEVTIIALADGDAAAGATIVTPLGTLLPAGLVIQVDDGQARKYEYSWCTRSGCFVRFGLEPEYITNLKRGVSARVRILSVTAPERPVDLRVSLKGFTAAYDGLPKQQPAQ